MNPGAIEEGGKVASNVVDAFKPHPALLLLVVLNLLFLGSALWFLNSLADSASRSREGLMKENSAHFDALLKLCAPRYGKWEP